MTFHVVWTGPARRDMRRLSREAADRVYRAVHRLADTGQGDVTRLAGTDDELRLRVGDWRVRFVFEQQSGTLTVLLVLPRGRAYRC